MKYVDDRKKRSLSRVRRRHVLKWQYRSRGDAAKVSNGKIDDDCCNQNRQIIIFIYIKQINIQQSTDILCTSNMTG